MTFRILYNGVEWTDTVTRFRGPIPGVTSKGDGTFATGQATLRDPTGVLTYLHLQTIRLVEDLCTAAPILFEGSIFNIHVDRGDYATGPGRVYTFSFTDLNGLLHDGVFRAASAKRPPETGNARMAWFLSVAPIAGIIYDHGLIGASPWNFDEADYRGRYPDEVLQDLSVSSVSEVGRIFYVYMHQATQQPSLFINSPEAAVRVSALAVSNVPGDYDGITTFRPLPGPSLDAAGEGIYCGVWFTTRNGSIYRHSATTHATYFGTSLRHRDGTFSTDRISLGETAERHVLAWLAKHSGPTETVSLTVRVPRNKVGLISAGERLPTRLEHLPGYEAGVNIRVASVTFPVDPGILNHYDLQLELSNRGIFGVGGGDPGRFPAQVSGPAVVIQHNIGVGNPATTLPNPITVGHLLIGWLCARGATPPATPAGWTSHGTTTIVGWDATTHRARLVSRVAQVGDESLELATGDGNHRVFYMETNASSIASVTMTPSTGPSGTLTLASVTGTGLVIGFVIMGPKGGITPPVSVVPDAGWTEIVDSYDGYGPGVWVAHSTTSLTPSGALSGDFIYRVYAGATVLLAGSPQQSPAPGQWVGTNPPEYVTMVGTGGTTAYPFANGSLQVFYDGQDQTAAIVSYDGAAGTFVMAAAPIAGMQVTVKYQGR